MKLTTDVKQRKNKILTAILLGSSLFLTACNDNANSTTASLTQHTQQGLSYLDQHQFKAAITAANNAITAYPEKIDGYLLLAKTYNQLGQISQSLAVLNSYDNDKDADYYFLLLDGYQKSNKLHSANKLLHSQSQLFQLQPERLALAKAQIFTKEHQLEQASALFFQLENSTNYRSDGLVGKARIQALSKDIAGAIITLDTVNELEGNNVESRLLQAYLYIEQGDLAKAETSLSTALSLIPSSDMFTPERINILQSLTEVLTLQGRSAEAMLYSRILAEEFPRSDSIKQQYEQASLLYDNNQLTEAKTVLEQILQHNPNYKKAATLLGVILYNLGDLQGAQQYFSNVIDPETNSAKLTQLYAITQLKLDRSADVLVMLENTISSETSAETLALYAIAAITAADFDKAKFAIDKITLLAPDSVPLALILSLYYTNQTPPQQQQSLVVLNQAIQLHPTNIQLQLSYIKQLLQLNLNSKADAYVLQLTTQANNNVQLINLIANYYLHQQQYPLATKQFNRILTLSESHQGALYGLAKIAQLNQHWQTALTAYNKLLSLHPQAINAYQGVLLSLLKLGRDPEQAPLYLPKNYNKAILALVLASYQSKQQKLQSASDYLEQAQTTLPENLTRYAQTLKQQLNFQQASKALAKKDFATARKITLDNIKLTPTHPKFLALLANIEIRSGQLAEAEKVLSQIEVIFPDNPLVNILTAELAVAKGKPQQAIKLLRSEWQRNYDDIIAKKLYLILQDSAPSRNPQFLNEWLQQLPKSIHANLHKALLLQELGENKQALVHYETILQYQPNQVTSLNNAAWLYFQFADPRAIKLAKKAYNLAPNNANVLDTYGWILFNSGDVNKAREILITANKLAPNDSNISAHLKRLKTQ